MQENQPVDDEVLIRSLLVADGTDPSGLLLVHLQVEGGVEALQVRARHCSARHRQTHLPQLPEKTGAESGAEEPRPAEPHNPERQRSSGKDLRERFDNRSEGDRSGTFNTG